MTTQDEIRGWLKSDKAFGCSHMLVVCDTFGWEEHPVYVKNKQDIKEVEALYNNNAQKVLEVYSFSEDIEMQLKSRELSHHDDS